MLLKINSSSASASIYHTQRLELARVILTSLLIEGEFPSFCCMLKIWGYQNGENVGLSVIVKT